MASTDQFSHYPHSFGSPINLSRKIFTLTYGITARAAFGEKSRDQEAFRSLVEEAVKLAAGFSIADMFPSVKMISLITGMQPTLEEMHRRIDQILEKIVNEHKKRKGTIETGMEEAEEDLVDVLLKFQKHGDLQFPFTDNGLKAVILISDSHDLQSSSVSTGTNI
ncbi:hypothetical protein F0562_001594 [Nyssa sinensis]|uniref:Uncharacterized protein n=1 Tax=Nyssa sinensis TaxID=561372 RepID=A0A5J5C7G9_9ASTE|nr:hypothetical protein F0562_001594 [Nyssa sinensis]